jgi:hypothetical protein
VNKQGQLVKQQEQAAGAAGEQKNSLIMRKNEMSDLMKFQGNSGMLLYIHLLIYHLENRSIKR